MSGAQHDHFIISRWTRLQIRPGLEFRRSIVIMAAPRHSNSAMAHSKFAHHAAPSMSPPPLPLPLPLPLPHPVSCFLFLLCYYLPFYVLKNVLFAYRSSAGGHARQEERSSPRVACVASIAHSARLAQRICQGNPSQFSQTVAAAACMMSARSEASWSEVSGPPSAPAAAPGTGADRAALDECRRGNFGPAVTALLAAAFQPEHEAQERLLAERRCAAEAAAEQLQALAQQRSALESEVAAERAKAEALRQEQASLEGTCAAATGRLAAASTVAAALEADCAGQRSTLSVLQDDERGLCSGLEELRCRQAQLEVSCELLQAEGDAAERRRARLQAAASEAEAQVRVGAGAGGLSKACGKFVMHAARAVGEGPPADCQPLATAATGS